MICYNSIVVAQLIYIAICSIKVMKGEEFVESTVKEKIVHFQQRFLEAKKEIQKVIVGQDSMIDSLFEALIANGHVLIEGVPGIGKTLLIRTLSSILGGSYSRIQFTPDLLPTDIVGVTSYEEGQGFFTIKGPVFANFVVGDEINRSPPKVQSALLQAMQEREVTIGKETFGLPVPFFVMASQNPIEHLGTYRLPEAQVDRFIFKILMDYPELHEEQLILERNLSLHNFTDFNTQKILSSEELVEAQKLVNKIYMDEKLKNYIIRLIDASRNPKKYDLDLSAKYVEYGASPRGGIGLFIAAKARALLNGRTFVTYKDVKDLAGPVLRHRIILNFEGQAEGITTDMVITEITKSLPPL